MSVKPRPHHQQYRSNMYRCMAGQSCYVLVECFKPNDSFDKVHCCFDKVERCLDIIASVDGALVWFCTP